MADGSQVDRFLQELRVARNAILASVGNLATGVREANDVTDLVQVVRLPVKVYLVPVRASGHEPT